MATLHIGHYLDSDTQTPVAETKETHENPYIAFAGVVALWITFFALIAFWPGTLENLWTTFLDYQLAIRVIVGTLLLPWTLATWVWHGTWATAVQAVTIGAILLTTLIIFRPTQRA